MITTHPIKQGAFYKLAPKKISIGKGNNYGDIIDFTKYRYPNYEVINFQLFLNWHDNGI
jgi:hypothetical protein